MRRGRERTGLCDLTQDSQADGRELRNHCQRRATDLAENKLLMTLCAGLIDAEASRPWFEDMSTAQEPAGSASRPVQLALAPSFDPALYGELVQFGTVLPRRSGIAVAPKTTT